MGENPRQVAGGVFVPRGWQQSGRQGAARVRSGGSGAGREETVVTESLREAGGGEYRNLVRSDQCKLIEAKNGRVITVTVRVVVRCEAKLQLLQSPSKAQGYGPALFRLTNPCQQSTTSTASTHTNPQPGQRSRQRALGLECSRFGLDG